MIHDEYAKGELGVYLVSDGTNRPHCCKIKVPPMSLDYCSSQQDRGGRGGTSQADAGVACLQERAASADTRSPSAHLPHIASCPVLEHHVERRQTKGAPPAGAGTAHLHEQPVCTSSGLGHDQVLSGWHVAKIGSPRARATTSSFGMQGQAAHLHEQGEPCICGSLVHGRVVVHACVW